MSTLYPGQLDTNGTASLPNVSGTETQDGVQGGVDHALVTTNVNEAVLALETALGTTQGTNMAKSVAAASDQFLIVNSGGSIRQPFTITNGTFTNPSIIGGSIYSGAFFNGGMIGTPTITSGVFSGTYNVTGTFNGGTFNGPVLGTPTIGTVIVPGTTSALSFSASIAPGVGSIADSAGGTLIVNAQQGNVFYSVLGTASGNRTIGTPLNPTGYQQLTYAIQASGSNNGTLVWATIFHVSQDYGTPVLGTGVAWSYYSWRYNQISTRWEFTGNINNIT